MLNLVWISLPMLVCCLWVKGFYLLDHYLWFSFVTVPHSMMPLTTIMVYLCPRLLSLYSYRCMIIFEKLCLWIMPHGHFCFSHHWLGIQIFWIFFLTNLQCLNSHLAVNQLPFKLQTFPCVIFSFSLLQGLESISHPLSLSRVRCAGICTSMA